MKANTMIMVQFIAKIVIIHVMTAIMGQVQIVKIAICMKIKEVFLKTINFLSMIMEFFKFLTQQMIVLEIFVNYMSYMIANLIQFVG